MLTWKSALSSGAFFVVAPGTVLGLIPWLITGFEFTEPFSYWIVAQIVGGLLICAGLVPLVNAFVHFAGAGGAPLPAAPTQHLVVGGFNRYVRNPMYVGLLLVVLGETLLFGQFILLIWALFVWLAPAAFVHWYEEPWLARKYGKEYETYRHNVPAWLPRLRPWDPSHG